jgi:glycosyltransferase involved in cell wall biosynthesis
MFPTIYADLRSLQDPCYRDRGIGYHVSALLATRRNSPLRHCRTIGLIDPHFDTLPARFRHLVDEISSSLNPQFGNGKILYFDGSPMTHHPDFSLRFQNHPGFIGAAVLYDFIPWDWPGYLPTVSHRISYLAKLARLRHFQLFFPISAYTGRRLTELLQISPSRIAVTGACVRRSLYEASARVLPLISRTESRPYFVTVGGDDRRKNTDVAVAAVKRLNLLYGRRIPLKVIGHYPEGTAYRADLFRLAGHEEGQGFLEFHSNISDDTFVKLHAEAVAAIAPSHIEGFSLPVAEAAVCGCPVLASSCEAQFELVHDGHASFAPSDTDSLTAKLEAVLNDSELRSSIVVSQSHLRDRFHEDIVGSQLWDRATNFLEFESSRRTTSGALPRLAFLSPYPPDDSEPALYTAETARAGHNTSFTSDLYTNAPRPLLSGGEMRDAGLISVAPMIDKGCSAVISVLGDPVYDPEILGVFQRFGGPCVLHTLPDASATTGHLNPNYLIPILRRAAPLIVKTEAEQALLKTAYGLESVVTATCPTLEVSKINRDVIHRSRMRQDYGISKQAFVVSTLGEPTRENGFHLCILASELLRSWRTPVIFVCITNDRPTPGDLDELGATYGITDHLYNAVRFYDRDAYQDLLVISDAWVQVRPVTSTENSSALHNALGVGVPCVANRNLAWFSGVQEHVSIASDVFSPLLLAEQMQLALQNGEVNPERRAAYLAQHNFALYTERLKEAVGIA